MIEKYRWSESGVDIEREYGMKLKSAIEEKIKGARVPQNKLKSLKLDRRSRNST